MLETLLAIKNNNMNKIPQYDPVHIEHLKKILKSFLRKGNTISPFEIGLNDLLQGNTFIFYSKVFNFLQIIQKII